VRLRTVLVALGVAAAAAGLAVAVQPSLAGGLSPTSALVTLVALLGLVGALGAARSRLRGRRREAALPAVERRRSFPTPGEGFDRRLAELPEHAPRSADRERALVRSRLRETAVDVLGRYGGLSPEGAEAALESGTWTTNPEAVAFFAPDADRALSLVDRVRDALGAERTFTRRARAVVDALSTYATEGKEGA
jgi:hypothetical protein